MNKAMTVNQPQRLYADAGYDAEWVHTVCREDWQVESIIKPAIHRSDGTMSGKYRSQMTPETLKEKGYGTRCSPLSIHIEPILGFRCTSTSS